MAHFTYKVISDMDVVSIWFDCFTKIDGILVPEIENKSPDTVHSPLLLLNIFTNVYYVVLYYVI